MCGTLQLPYAEIKEPFCAYYDKKSNKSRIDYYPGWFEHDGRGCVCIWLGGRRVALLWKSQQLLTKCVCTCWEQLRCFQTRNVSLRRYREDLPVRWITAEELDFWCSVQSCVHGERHLDFATDVFPSKRHQHVGNFHPGCSTRPDRIQGAYLVVTGGGHFEWSCSARRISGDKLVSWGVASTVANRLVISESWPDDDRWQEHDQVAKRDSVLRKDKHVHYVHRGRHEPSRSLRDARIQLPAGVALWQILPRLLHVRCQLLGRRVEDSSKWVFTCLILRVVNNWKYFSENGVGGKQWERGDDHLRALARWWLSASSHCLPYTRPLLYYCLSSWSDSRLSSNLLFCIHCIELDYFISSALLLKYLSLLC